MRHVISQSASGALLLSALHGLLRARAAAGMGMDMDMDMPMGCGDMSCASSKALE